MPLCALPLFLPMTAAGRLAVEFTGSPPHAAFAEQHVDMTLWAQIGDKLTTAAAAGLWTPSPTFSFAAGGEEDAENLWRAPAGVSFVIAGESDGEHWQLKKGRLRLFDDSITAVIDAAAAGDKNGVTLAGGVFRLADAPVSAVVQYLPKAARDLAAEWSTAAAAAVNIDAAGLWRGGGGGWTVNNGRVRLFNDEIQLAAAVTIVADGGESRCYKPAGMSGRCR